MPIAIAPFAETHREAVLALSLRAWEPVFASMRNDMPAYQFAAFYPKGWEARQTADISAVLDDPAMSVRVAIDDGEVVGWIGTRLHPGDSMGEIYILAVDPAHQQRGIASALIESALDALRAAGMAMAMVETGGDPGHAPSRATYEKAGFAQWPVARYFRQL